VLTVDISCRSRQPISVLYYSVIVNISRRQTDLFFVEFHASDVNIGLKQKKNSIRILKTYLNRLTRHTLKSGAICL